MLLLEGIGAIVIGLWVMSQGTGPGESIMIVLGLPVVLFGAVLTIIGFAKSMKEKAPDVSDSGAEQSPTKRSFLRTIEDDVSLSDSAERQSLTREQQVRVRNAQGVQERQSKKRACPECGAKYGLIDLMGQPTMCSKCWKKTKSSSIG